MAYNNLINSKHKKLITDIKSEVHDTGLFIIIIKMGVKVDNSQWNALPLIGEVQLRIGFINTNEILNILIQELVSTNDFKSTMMMVERLYLDVQEFNAENNNAEMFNELDKELTNTIIINDVGLLDFDELAKNEVNVYDYEST